MAVFNNDFFLLYALFGIVLPQVMVQSSLILDTMRFAFHYLAHSDSFSSLRAPRRVDTSLSDGEITVASLLSATDPRSECWLLGVFNISEEIDVSVPSPPLFRLLGPPNSFVLQDLLENRCLGDFKFSSLGSEGARRLGVRLFRAHERGAVLTKRVASRILAMGGASESLIADAVAQIDGTQLCALMAFESKSAARWAYVALSGLQALATDASRLVCTRPLNVALLPRSDASVEKLCALLAPTPLKAPATVAVRASPQQWDA